MKKKRMIGIAFALLALGIVFYIEQVVQPGYAIKSAVKLTSFLSAIALYSYITKQRFVDVIRLRKIKNAKSLTIAMVVCFVGIAILFIALKDRLDLNGIKTSLMAKEKYTKANCLYAFAYIILVNSFLEEAFFRGFVCQLLENKKVGAVFSAILFAIYHLGIVMTWFDPLLLIICISGLAAVGLFLQWLSNKYNSIQASWMAHGCANIAINTIGALLIFEII